MMKHLAVLAVALLAACAAPMIEPSHVSPSTATAGEAGALPARINAAVESHRDELIALRRDLHRNPELSGEEERTAGIVAARLQALGFEVRRGVGGHGVVGVLRGARPGRIIAFRADMDAVRDPSPDPVEFRSERPGVRHICGHDIHTTIGLALAEGFAAVRGDLAGTIVLLFQPAEETATGARAMIADGALTAPRPDAIFGFHTAPFEVGTFVTSEAVLMTIRDRAILTVSGAGADAITRDLVTRLSALSTVPPFTPQPADGAWVNVNTGPSALDEDGRLATPIIFNLATETARANVRNAIDRAVAAANAANSGARIEASYEPGWVPGIRNDAGVARAATESIRAELGEDAARYSTTIVPGFSEDFGHMQALVPSAFFYIGVSNSARNWVGMPHSPDYVADEEAIFIGARAMARIMLDAMGAPSAAD